MPAAAPFCRKCRPADRPALDFRCVSPLTLALGTRRLAVGEVVYVLAAFLKQKRYAGFAAVKVRVWGPKRGAGVSDNTLTKACTRLNVALRELGSTARVGASHGRLELYPRFTDLRSPGAGERSG